MIPRLLQIKNFLSYGPDTQTIDFADYHLICLSGKNGHGKSAMLDAITWAIWGQARKSSGNSKPDAGLLHLGQKHMMIILEFEVNGQNYRIRREYLNTASKPFATLDFGIQQADGKQIALTDKTIKDTQEKIERTIGITYESFTNSTFLRQGQSNEFSKKSPKERKEILAQILQLSKFDDQKKIALQHARKLQQDYITQTNILQRIEQELINLSSVPELYAKIQIEFKTVEEQKQKNSEKKTQLNFQQQELQQQFNEYIFLMSQKEDFEKKIATTQQEIIQKEQDFQQKTIIQDLTVLKQQEDQLHTLIQQFQRNQQKKLQLKETYLLTKEKLTEITNKAHQEYEFNNNNLQVQLAKLQEALLHIHKQISSEQANHKLVQTEFETSQKQVHDVEEKIKILNKIKEEYQTAQENFEKNKITYQNVCAQGTFLKQQLSHQAIHSNSQHTIKNVCDLCNQALNQQQKEYIAQKILIEQEQTEQELNSLKQQAQHLKNDLTSQQTTLLQMRQQYEECIQLTAQLQELSKHHEKSYKTLQSQTEKIESLQKEGAILEQNISKLQDQINAIQDQLKQQLQHPDLIQITASLKAIEQEAKDLAYNPENHQKAEQELTQIRKIISQQTLLQDSAAQAEQKAYITQLYKNIQAFHEQLQPIITKLTRYAQLEQRKQELTAQEQQLMIDLQQLDTRYKALLLEKGSLEHKQKKRIDLETELQSIQVSSKSLYQEMIDYQEIAKALGKDGIQALLIEQAIPEIEHETNQILARLTNNQTQIFIESLRDLKKGGARETLDIKIADSFGLRDYEMFSGGEAFRIDFALRIGISKLLARRAGTTLQTIFIDEGFGSQDEEGLQLIMDNIYKIQDDFAKIIIVSHLPEMKEQFPVQFVIEKKRSGSMVSVIQQG